jgi:5'-methylthioadenosine phosphorylase
MDVVGMTNLQEAKLAREAEICYATLAMITDYDCWHPDHDSVTVEQVIGVLRQNTATAHAVLRAAIRRIGTEARACPCASALQNAIMTPSHLVPEATKRDLRPLVGKYLN